MASQSLQYDKEWAESLIGLRVKVPEYWWVALRGRKLHDGKIASFDESNQKWMFVCDSDPKEPYAMAYPGILEYADQTASTYPDFDPYLTAEPVLQFGDEEGAVQQGETHFRKTHHEHWNKIDEENPAAGRRIDPIPWTGGDKQFSVDIDRDRIEEFKDQRGEIKYEKLFIYALPQFRGREETEDLFTWQAARMRNYMLKIVKDADKPYKPRYYKPNQQKVITNNHVARFYGCLLAKMLSGYPSNEQAFSTRDSFDAVEPIKRAMTLDAMKELTRCLHYGDDWIDEDWADYEDAQVAPDEGTAIHRRKFAMVEEAYNKRWQELLKFGKWLISLLSTPVTPSNICSMGRQQHC